MIMVMTKSDLRCMALLYVSMLLLTGIPALMFRVNTTVDELGNMANAALLSGRNWHIGVVSVGGYYFKYGQGLLWILPFLLLKDSFLIFKAACFINALCISVTPVIAYYIGRRYLHIEKELPAAALAGGCTFVGDVLFHGGYLRGDNMLIVLNWVCALLLLNGMYAKTGRRRIVYSVLLSLSAVYAYACHSRGIVAVIAVVTTVLILRIFLKKKCVHNGAFFISLAVFLVIDRLLQGFFKAAIWGDGAAHAVGIPRESLRLLFTASGLMSYLKMCVGWLFSAFTSTAGLVCAGLVVCVVVCWKMVWARDGVTAGEGALAVYGGLSFLGSFVLGTVFFEKYVHENFTGESMTRLDHLVYDRYLCCTFGILCLLALYALIWKKDWFGIRAKVAAIAGYAATFAIFAVKVAPVMNRGEFLRRFTGILCLFLRTNRGKPGFSGPHVAAGFLLCGVVMFGLFLILLWMGSGKKARRVCAVAAAAGIVLYGFNTYSIRLCEDRARVKKLEYAREIICSFGDLYKEYPVVWMDGTSQKRVYQAALINYDLMSSKYQRYKETDNVLVIGKSLPSRRKLKSGKYYMIDGVDYGKEKRDIVYVKGEALKDKLESMGVSTTPYERGE